MNFFDKLLAGFGYHKIAQLSPQQSVAIATVPIASNLPYNQQVVSSQPMYPTNDMTKDAEFRKNAIEEKTALAQDPLYLAYQQVNTEQGLRKPSKVTFMTLRRMSRANWVDRTCINTLRDEISAVPWDIVPVDSKKGYSETFRQYIIDLLNNPNRNNENWRTFIDKIIEDILVLDAGVVEKVRDQKGRIAELYYVDGGTIKPCFDEYGVVASPAYLQYLPNARSNSEPVAEFDNDDLIYMMWNPQGAMDTYGYGMSPVEAGLSVGSAFLYAEAYNLGFFRQNTIPPTIINMGRAVPQGQVDSFKTFLAAEMMGEGGFWKPVIGSFGDGFDVKQLIKAPNEMGFKDYVEWQMRWKVALYRMSPQDIGFSLDQYKVEGQVQQQLSKNKAIASLKNVLEGYINREILGDFGWGVPFYRMNLKFQWIDADAVNPLDQAKIDDTYIKNGTRTINEIRQERFGLDPIAGGQKPYILQGTNLVTLDATPVDESKDEDENENQEEDSTPEPIATDEDTDETTVESDDAEKSTAIEKKFSPEEGLIQSMAQNQTAICWMDDRGVTQPLFVTDFGKSMGFTIKPSFLDDKKGQEPPEAEVSKILRALKVNTPEVQIMSYDEVVKLLPVTMYGDFTKWINLEAPFNSQEWRQRWGNTRKSDYYIVTGFIQARDLHDQTLKQEMAVSPESFKDAVNDLARVWLAERKFGLGDRKPGHYLITKQGNGFGVDYQFFHDDHSWKKTSIWLPKSLEEISPVLKQYFDKCIAEHFAEFDTLEKAFRGRVSDGTPQPQVEDIEKKMAQAYQKAIYTWFKKAVRVNKGSEQALYNVKKAMTEFDPTLDYVTNGEYVYQNGNKYPITVLDEADRPSSNDLKVPLSEYRGAWDYGLLSAEIQITPLLPGDMKVANPALYEPAFQDRIDQTADVVGNSLGKELDQIILSGFEEDTTFGDVADKIMSLFGIMPDDPTFPGWRAMRIARTETNYAINEGMRQQYQQTGIKQVNVSPAPTACDICMELASGNPYQANDASGLLPAHPNCRCILVGDWSQFGL